MREHHPRIAIVIPARNEEAVIGKCLDSIGKLRYPREKLEVMVVDDGSTDATGKIVRSKKIGVRLKLLKTRGVGPSGARNLAAENTSARFIAFTDADCIVSPDWLERLLEGFDSGETAGVGGIQKSPRDDTRFGKRVQFFLRCLGFISDYCRSAGRLQAVSHSASCNVMYRKKVFDEAGGFDERLWPGEDVELDLKIKRMGFGLRFNPRAVVYHYRPRNLGGFARMMFNYGAAQAYLVQRFGFFRPLHAVPLASVFAVWLALVLLRHDARLGLLFPALLSAAVLAFFLFKANFSLGKAARLSALFAALLIAWHSGFYSFFLGEWRK